MPSDSAAFCKSDKAVDKIAHALNKGNGDKATNLLSQCLVSRVAADPESHKAWTDFQKAETQDKNRDTKFDAADVYIAAGQKVQTEFWKSVVDAQNKDSDSHLCKLELTMDGTVATKAELNGPACKKTQYKLR
jgi:plastocyanin